MDAFPCHQKKKKKKKLSGEVFLAAYTKASYKSQVNSIIPILGHLFCGLMVAVGVLCRLEFNENISRYTLCAAVSLLFR